MVRSEGVGSLVLHIEDGPLRGVGSAVRQDGRSASLTAPNGSAQRKLLMVALSRASAHAAQMEGVEAHGTGTALGDPTETGAIAAVHDLEERAVPLTVGAAKASVGHSFGASGHVGLLRMQEAFTSSARACNAQLRRLNPLVYDQLANAHVLLPSQAVVSGRLSGVSSFGYSGTIAHAVLAFGRGGGSEALAAITTPPLSYRRRAFLWREVTTACKVDRTCMYSVCWADLPPIAIVQTASWMLLAHATAHNHAASHSLSHTLAVLVHADASAAAPSLHGTRLSLALAQRLTGHTTALPRLLVLTCGALASAGGRAASDAVHGGAWGFARVLRLEHPAGRTQSADVSTAGASAASPLALLAPSGEVEVVWRGSECFAARLRACEVVSSRGSFLAHGVYKLTGGLGGLGVRAAALVIEGGVCAVLLASRSGRVARDGQGLEAHLRSTGSVTAAVACDSADSRDAASLLSGPPTSGVLHAAGVLCDALIRSMASEDLLLPFAPKALAASHIHLIASSLVLEALGLFSSIASTFGSVGQANYAAANCCLDTLAFCRRLRGLFASSLQIPAVGGAGMGASSFAAEQLDHLGAISLDEFAAHLSISLALARAATEQTHAPLSSALLEAIAPTGLCEHKYRSVIVTVPPVGLAGRAMGQRIAEATPSQRLTYLEASVLRTVRELTGASSDTLAAETPLMEAGVDSLAATELTSRLRAFSGVALSPTLIFEQPTTRAIAAHLLAQLTCEASAGAPAQPTHSVCTGAPLALAASIAQWPGSGDGGAARSQRRAVYREARSCVSRTRWVLDEAVGVRMLIATQVCMGHGGFVQGVHCLDVRALGLSPADAGALDPPFRLQLERGHASQRRGTLLGGDSATCVDANRPKWAIAQPLSGHSAVYAVTGDAVSVAAGRVSLALELKGPCGMGAEMAHFECYLPTPRSFRRCAFLWREAASTRDADLILAYSMCWTKSPPIAIVQSALCVLLFACTTAHNDAAPSLASHALAVLLYSDATAAAPSLHGTRLAFALAQCLPGNTTASPRLLVLMCGALACGGRAASDGAHGGAWGFARVMRLEHPTWLMQSADVSSQHTRVAADLALTASTAEAEASWRESECFTARLHAGAATSSSARGGVLARSLYAITGGFGSLGLRATALLSEHGASMVLLTSRSGHVAHNRQCLEAQLRSKGTAVAAVACDSADALEAGAMLSASLLGGVLHAAGVIHDKWLRFLTFEDSDKVFASKASAAWYLQTVVSRTPLEASALFSSMSSAVGSVGQGNYAAANAYLDATALCRSSLGTPWSSLQIPAIRGFTMAAMDQAQLDAIGAVSLDEFAVCLSVLLVRVRGLAERVQLPLLEAFAIKSGLHDNTTDAGAAKPAALWRHPTLLERCAASQKAIAALDKVMLNMRSSEPASKDVVVVGAGLAGISAATQFAAAGVGIAVVEKSKSPGGVWRSYGNAFSRVNSTEPGYRLRLKHRLTPNSNHSHCHEILSDVQLAFEQFLLDCAIYSDMELVAMSRAAASTAWQLLCLWECSRRVTLECEWAILCTNRRLGAPRTLTVAGAEHFQGQLRRGISNDTLSVAWKGHHVLILGHGPYATENARTALEHAAARVVFAVRRHGIICPELVDYVNYIRDYDSDFNHPAGGSATIVSVWREAYRVSKAVPPEVWAKGRFLPDGHTVSISDLYFVAHFVEIMSSVVGVAKRFDESSLTLTSNQRIATNVVIMAVGFEANEGNEKILGRSRVHGGLMYDCGLWTIVESHPDGNFSSSVFGSYLDAVPFKTRTMLRYWRDRGVYQRQCKRVAVAHDTSARINRITSSEEARGMAPFLDTDPVLVAMMREHASEVADFSHNAWSPSHFLEHNRFHWEEIHARLSKVNGVAIDAQMPYPMEAAIDAVAHEKPELFPERVLREQREAAAPLAKCGDTSPFGNQIAGLAYSQRESFAEAAVLRIVRELTDQQLDETTPLMEAGVDSLAATELSSRLGKLIGKALSPTLIFEQPTPRSLASHLLEFSGELSGCRAVTVIAHATASLTTANETLAVVGVAGCWPGGCTSNTVRAQMQAACGDAVGGVPQTRWVLEKAVDANMLRAEQAACVRHGGFVLGAQRFDTAAFSVSPAEVGAMDPQQRLLLEYGYASLHGSLHRRTTLLRSDVGVLVGIERPDWALAQPPSARGSAYAVTSDNVSVAAGRVSFVLGLQGPCSSVDTACSSALAAVHWGSCASREGNGSNVALAASLKLLPYNTLGMASAGMLSVDGRCQTLDARANGMVRSEGVGALVLHPGDNHTLALGGSAVRQDGRSASLTAPNGSAQRVLLFAALGCAGVTPVAVGSVEAHGTGTALGDPTEAGALAAVHGGRRMPLAVGAAKASVGHSEAASGQIGILKVQQMRADLGNAQLRSLNPLVGQRLGSSCSCFLLTAQEVGVRRASVSGVSSFGYSGTIAHVVLSICMSSLRKEPDNGRRLPLAYRRLSFLWEHPFRAGADRLAVRVSNEASASMHDAQAQDVLTQDAPLMAAGISSIAAIRLAAHLRSETQLDLSPTLIFEHPTPHAIASHLKELGCTGSFSTPAAIVTVVEDLLTSMASPAQANERDHSPVECDGLSGEWRKVCDEVAPGASTAGALPYQCLRQRKFHLPWS